MVVRAKTINTKRNESRALKFWSELSKLTRTSLRLTGYQSADRQLFQLEHAFRAFVTETTSGGTFVSLLRTVYLDFPKTS